MPASPWRRFGSPEPDREYVALLSYLPLKSYWRIPFFFLYTTQVVKQLASAEGMLGYSVLARPLSKGFWTLSAWTDDAALRSFVQPPPHVRIMMRCAVWETAAARTKLCKRSRRSLFSCAGRIAPDFGCFSDAGILTALIPASIILAPRPLHAPHVHFPRRNQSLTTRLFHGTGFLPELCRLRQLLHFCVKSFGRNDSGWQHNLPTQ